MPRWIIMALQTAQASDASGFDLAREERPRDKITLSTAQRCAAPDNSADIVICARTRADQRLQQPDPRFEDPLLDADGRLIRRLSDTATLRGGGPKASVGLTLKLGF
jgi:hypothetical protein